MSIKRAVVVVIVLAVLAGGGYWVRSHFFKRARKGGGSVITVTSGSIEETIPATGSVAPLNRVEIKAPISGRIEQLLVDEGAKVQQAQILAWMSSTDRASILDAARAKGPDEYKRWLDTYQPTPIIAPLSGVIILKNVVVGQTVDPSLVVYAMSDVLVTVAQVDESDIGKLHLGMPTRVWLDSYPDKIQMGKIFDILYEGKNVSNVIQYTVKVKVDPVPDFYRSQMTVNFSFIVRKKDNVLLLPAVALHMGASGVSQVEVPGQDGKPEMVDVKTGIESGDKVEILDGVAEGDSIILAQGHYTPQVAPQNSPFTTNMPSGRSGGGGGGGARR